MASNESTFNMEEFLNFMPAETSPTEDLEEITTENTSSWDQYPNLWPPQRESVPEDPISLITFDGASLMKEEYVDPFASINVKSQNDPKEEFLKKLVTRRKKLEELARTLKSKSITNMRCSENAMRPNWHAERNTVQAYSVVNIVLDRDCKESVESRLGMELYEVLCIYNPTLLPYL